MSQEEPSAAAMSPPLAQTRETPLRQSCPGNQKPENAGSGFAFFSVVAACTNSSRVVGTATPAFSNRSLR